MLFLAVHTQHDLESHLVPLFPSAEMILTGSLDERLLNYKLKARIVMADMRLRLSERRLRHVVSSECIASSDVCRGIEKRKMRKQTEGFE
jgi:hypothetical protein